MKGRFESLEQLRRTIYLWILPFFIVSLLFSGMIEYQLGRLNKDYLMLSAPLLCWFTISWIFLYKRLFLSFFEISGLILSGWAHLKVFNGSITTKMIPELDNDYGVFIVWLPLYIMSIFISLNNVQRLAFSFGYIGITIGIAIYHWKDLPTQALQPITQYIAAQFVYVIILYFAQHILRALAERDILHKSAYTDALTGIANRQQLDFWLENQIEDAKKQDEGFSILFFDIDHFKNINDTFGHKIGDAVLIDVAKTVKENLSDQDSFARWGGEEFMILTKRKGEEALTLAEQLRKKIETHPFPTVNKVTASFGVTFYQPDDTMDTLLNRADKGLYLSKRNGRNQVQVTGTTRNLSNA